MKVSGSIACCATVDAQVASTLHRSWVRLVMTLFLSVQVAYALAFVGLLAILSPAADARRLLQSSSITDADILNFALNLEVS